MLAGTTDISTEDAFSCKFYPVIKIISTSKHHDNEHPQLHTIEKVTDLRVTKLILNLNTVLWLYSVVMSGVCMLQYKCQVWWWRCNPPPAVWVAVSWASNLSAPALGSCVSLCHCLPCLWSSYLSGHTLLTLHYYGVLCDVCVRLLLKVPISLSLIHILSCQSLCLHIRNKYVEVALLGAGQQSSSQLRGEGWSVAHWSYSH